MSRPPVTHRRVQATRSAAIDVVRTPLVAVEVDRHKRIDHYIDYFGSGGALRPTGTSDVGDHPWHHENGAP